MYNVILSLHHYIAFAAVFFLAFATINGIIGSNSGKVFEDFHRKINVFALISTHTMFLLGVILLIVSPLAETAFADMALTMKNAVLRKAVIEHPTTNIIAVVLATIGNAKSKKAIGNGKRFKVTMIYFGLALILSRMPWEKLF
jgi:hypothetical protein